MRQRQMIVGLATLLGILMASAPALAPAPRGPAQQSAEELYQAALLKEDSEGDLHGAVKLFEDLIVKFPGKRDVAAKALLHIGMCYEKLGKAEARKAYSRLLKDYGDQLQPAKEARSRLARLEAVGGGAPRESAGLVFRKLDIADAGHSHQARLSPDGSKFLYIGYQDKEPRYNLRVLDIASGRSRTVVEGVDADTATLIFEWSPDATKAVYWAGRGELRVVDLEGGTSEHLWTCPEKGTAVRPLDWSAENHAVLIALINSTEKTVRLAILSEKGGEPRIVVSGRPNDLADIAQFSPDGNYVAGMKRTEKNTDVYVWRVDGSGESRVTDHPADDEYPLWSPDGRHIVFASNRAKTVDLWAVPMDGSRPVGEPVRIQADIGKNKIPSDLTRSGQLMFYAMRTTGSPSDLFVLPVDPKTGKSLGRFRPYADYPTQASRWSPDGTRIAYTSRKGNIQLPNAYISAGGSGEELEVPAKSYWMGNIEWARDGKHLLFPGWNSDDGLVGIFRIVLGGQAIEPVYRPGEKYGSEFTGAFINLRWLPLAGNYMFFSLLGEGREEIFLMDPKDHRVERIGEKGGMGGFSIPSPDGRYLIAPNFGAKTIELVPTGDGASKVLCKSPATGFPAFSWSPDAKSFVWNDEGRLRVDSVVSGTSRTLVEAGPDKTFGPGGLMSGTPNTAFSPDGTKIAYVLQDAAGGPGRGAELWVVEAAGGAPRKVADAPASHPLLGEVVWHPSGKMIFARGNAREDTSRIFEHWVMENFLPPAPAAGTSGEREYRMTRIPTDPAVANIAFISPDGKKLAIAGMDGDIWVRDIAAATDTRLTDTPAFEYWCFWSPDSRKIAFMDSYNGLHIVPAGGGKPVTLIKPDSEFLKSGKFAWPTGWTPDGRTIVCHVSGRGLCALPEDGSAWRDVFPYATPAQEKDMPLMIPSPDNTLVAYVSPASGNGDIRIMRVKGGEPVRVADHPASDNTPTWSCDGRHLAFISGRSGEDEIWVVGISAEGEPDGEPVQITKGGTGRNSLFLWTRRGTIGLSKSPMVQNLFVTDRASGKETQLTRMLTNDQRPRWSPDGTRIAYLSEKAGKWDIWVVTAGGGEPKLVTGSFTGRAGVELIRAPVWLPDGKSLGFVVTLGADDQRGIWVIPAEAGEARKVDFKYEGSILNMDWSPDGKSIVFEYNGREGDQSVKGSRIYESDIYVIPAGGGEPQRITKIDRPRFGFIRPRWSPDGKKIAFLSDDWTGSGEINNSRQIWVADLETGKTGPISKGLTYVWQGLGWAPDGKAIYYSARVDNKDHVFSIPVQGGEPTPLNIQGTFAECSPDGSKLVYSRMLKILNEAWLIENFLPPDRR